MEEIEVIKLMLDRLKKEKKMLITELATSRAENKFFNGRVKELNKSMEIVEERNENLRKSSDKQDRIIKKLSRTLKSDVNFVYDNPSPAFDDEEEEDNFYKGKFLEVKKELRFQVTLNRKLESQLERHVKDEHENISIDKQERAYQSRKIDQLKSQIELEKQKYSVLESQNEKLKEKNRSFRKRIREGERENEEFKRYKAERDEARKRVKSLLSENENLKSVLLSLNLILDETKRVKGILERELSDQWEEKDSV